MRIHGTKHFHVVDNQIDGHMLLGRSL